MESQETALGQPVSNDHLIVAFDQAFKTTGFAVVNKDTKEILMSGTFSTSAADSDEKRLGNIYHFVTNMFNQKDNPGIKEIVIEDIQMQRMNASTYKKLAWVQSVFLLAAEHLSIPIYVVSPSSWRSILTKKYHINFGKKRADQKKAAKEFAAQFSDKVTTDSADAICIGLAQAWSL